MQIKNIQSPDQLFSLAEKIHNFLREEVHTDDIECGVKRGHILASYMASTGKALADARYWKDKAVRESILFQMRDSKAMNLPASTLNELIKADNKDLNYLVNFIEQLDKECKYQIEWLRTVVSKEKAQMYLQSQTAG